MDDGLADEVQEKNGLEERLDSLRRAGAVKKSGSRLSRTPTSRRRGSTRVPGIQRMSASDSHLLRSSQSLLDPASVVKELLENALDAHATRIDIRIQGKAGLDTVTVSDNGNGIASQDFSHLCTRSSTSKAELFEDLDYVTTFGFRGEALSAICGTCRSVNIVTRTRNDSSGYSLRFSREGELVEKKTAPRPVGTTVQAEALFHNLPVRRQHALKQAPREIAKCVAIAQAYAIIASDVRIELKVGSDVKVLSIPRARNRLNSSTSDGPVGAVGIDLTSVRHSATSVLGKRTVYNLADFQADNFLDPDGTPVQATKLRDDATQMSDLDAGENRQDAPGTVAGLAVAGLVSSVELSRSNTARTPTTYQFLYLNRRPVDIPRLTRALNDIFRRVTGNSAASPVFILNISLPPGTFDVNLAPDKRHVVCENETRLIAEIALQLEKQWSPREARSIPHRQLDLSRVMSSGTETAALDECLASQRASSEIHASSEQTVQRTKRPGKEAATVVGAAAHDDEPPSPKRPRVQTEVCENISPTAETGEGIPAKMVVPSGHPNTAEELEETGAASAGTGTDTAPRTSGANRTDEEASGRRPVDVLRRLTRTGKPRRKDITDFVARRRSRMGITQPYPVDSGEHAEKLDTPVCEDDVEIVADRVQIDQRPSTRESYASSSSKDISVTVDWGNIFDSTRTTSQESEAPMLDSDFEGNAQREPKRGFMHASIANGAPSEIAIYGESPTQQQAAELEMTKLFRQEWFGDMHIIGQFNRGFIVCRLHNELFIVDQHASDEKYNFEQLQRDTELETQRLLHPLPLELSAEDELIVAEHLDGFRLGGFCIDYNAERPPTQRLSLRSQPVSKSTMFVMDDVQEMVATLKRQGLSHWQGPLRPARVRTMLASRACRKSVMIGTALDTKQMKSIVRNLTGLEHPWTCPHGRPTMRHLCTLETD